MKAHLLKGLLALMAAAAASCTLPRTAETDRLGWTDPSPPLPPLTDHSPTPGIPPYNRGVSPVTQPDAYSMRGSVQGSLTSVNGPLAY